MRMLVCVWFGCRLFALVRVLMCFVVNMRMRVRQGIVYMLMFVPLRQMQPDTECHQCSRR